MERVPVRSSNIESVGYDTESQTLEVKFKGTGVYRYAGVPAAIHTLFLSAASKGQYFDRHIRNRFRTTKVS